MKLYKYKSLSDFEFVADILINNQLYASHYMELNDPMEGDFTPDINLDYNDLIKKEMESIRVCSLSKDLHNPILWAHYADGFKGVCIEIEANESLLDLHKINYGPFNPIPSEGYRGMHGDTEEYTARDWAKSSLRGKYEEWEYENEYRIFSDSTFISSGFQITAIYFGKRTSEIYKNVIRNLVSEDIKIKDTVISGGNVHTHPLGHPHA